MQQPTAMDDLYVLIGFTVNFYKQHMNQLESETVIKFRQAIDVFLTKSLKLVDQKEIAILVYEEYKKKHSVDIIEK